LRDFFTPDRDKGEIHMARTASCDFLEVYKLMDMDVHDLLLNFWAFNERSLRLTIEKMPMEVPLTAGHPAIGTTTTSDLMMG